MSGPKKWVSSKVHRKSISKSSMSSIQSGSSSLDDRPPSSPPTRLPNEDATAIIDFGSGSTLVTQTERVTSNSSIDSASTGLTPSPSTTPPKKTWEKNYKTFLKRNGKHTKSSAPVSQYTNARVQHTCPIKPLPRGSHNHHSSHTRSLQKSALDTYNHQPHISSQNCEDLGPNLADGFEDRSHTSQGSAATAPDARMSPLTEPPTSPSKFKESSGRGGAFFKKLRGKTKSVENLDGSRRRGIDRKSPVNTPPGSAASTPINRHSHMTSTDSMCSVQEGLEKAAMLSDLLFPPSLPSSISLEPNLRPKIGHVIPHRNTSASHGNLNGSDNLDEARHRGHSVRPKIGHTIPHRNASASHGNLNGGDNLDEARHRGHSESMAPSTFGTQQTSHSSPIKPTIFSRVQSMGSNLIIPEGQPIMNHNEEEELIRERKKVFTDFHNMGIDSSSAFLGDESSLHKHSMFLSSMAYPAGSALAKSINGQQHHKSVNVPSSSMDSMSGKGSQEAETEYSPERALRPLKDPEHWTKGERHAIVPAVLCMCPIQVLNNIMSKDEVSARRPSSATQRGFGIGSIISEDDGGDSNGWFFADHHQPSPIGGVMPRTGGNTNNNNSLPSAFGKMLLGKATVAPLGMRSFLNEVYGWTTGVFILRQNYLFEFREGDSLNGLPWGYAHLHHAEAYPHKHFTNALHLDFLERPCSKSGKRSLLLRVESKAERDRWVSLLHSAARMTVHDLYDVDDSEGAPEFGHGRYAVVRPAKRRDRRRNMSFSTDTRYAPTTSLSQSSFCNVPSLDSLGGKSSNPDLENSEPEYDCALKIIDKREFWSRVKKGRERPDTLVREAAVQTTLAVQGADAPGFLQLRNIFEIGETVVLELELLKGTDLFQHISSRGVLDEVEAAGIMRDLLSCLNVLDQVGIAHRDIKPANLLMCSDDDISGAKIKLADYGMASFVGVDNLVRGRCGTPGFVAPEILLTGVNGGYGNKVDIFSAGVTLYVMLSGYEPFYGESDTELIDANREAKVDFPHADWHSVSVEGRDLIERMIVVDPAQRIGAREALRHPWITRRAPSLPNNNHPQQAVCSIC